MVDALFRFLITIVVLALLFFVTIWALGQIGIVMPAMVLVCLRVLAVLVVLLIAWRFFSPYLTGWTWGGWRGPPGPGPGPTP